MRKFFTLLSVAFLCQWVTGQNILTSASTIYSQNFDVMGSSGTTSTYPDNWTGLRLAGSGTAGAVINPTVGTGSSNSGTIYNFGLTGNANRALGSVASGTTIPAFGTSFINNTGNLIGSVSLSGLSEQWRTGNDATIEHTIFEYSTDATALNNGTWTALSSMDLVEIRNDLNTNTNIDGSAAANQLAISGTIANLNLNINDKLWIRWRDPNDAGNDGGYAIDNFELTYASAGPDVTQPTVSTLTPADNSTDVPINQTFAIRFSENIQKGTGNIYLKKADGTTVQTLDVTSSAVTVSNNVASFNFSTLDLSTSYYIEVSSGAFKDLSNNNFAGISGNTAWNFTTTSTFLSFNFNTCTSYAPVVGGFTQYSVVGDSIWKCTTFGNNSTGGVQMNGYNNATASNDANEDWLISPALNLSGTNIPLLRFSTINAFAGPQLRLFISTNYTPGNAPSTASWTELNGKFPAQNTRAWTVSDSINLSGYAQNGVYIAWVYYSTTAAAARWTLDDVSIFNSSVAPSPDITIAPGSINFGYIASGTNSYWQAVTFTSSSLSNDLTLSTTAPFQLSTDTTIANTSSTLTYPLASVSGSTQTFYVRFAPPVTDQVYSNAIVATAGNYNKAVVSLSGLSVPVSKTLEIVNWNMEWFGSPDPTLGPTNKDLQFTNALKVLRYLDADIYSLVEIVDTSRFRKLADSLGSDYGYIVCNYGTRAINPANQFYSTNIATAQKEGFIYKKSIFSNVTARPFLLTNYSDTTIPSSYYWWSSGRFPYIMETDANLNGVNKHLTFVLLHAKANTGDVAAQIESYNRRKAGVLNMKDTLDINYNNANIIILGDYNDKLTGTIAPTTGADTVSSYQSFVADSTDGNSYKSITLPFATTGSTVGGNADIDNVIISNEMVPFFLNGSAQIRSDVVSLFGNTTTYSNTTTDHYPIYTRYFFGSPILPVKLLSFTGKRQGTTSTLQWQVTAEENVEMYEVERSTDGRQFKKVGTVIATNNIANTKTYQFADVTPLNGYNYYRLKMIDKDGKSAYSTVVKIFFGKQWQVSLSPNPVKDVLYVQSSQAVKLTVNVYDAVGRKSKQFTNLAFAEGETRQLSLSRLQKGTYTVEILSGTDRVVNKIVVE